jgi:hypothetical protein
VQYFAGGLLSQVELDPEAGMFCARGSHLPRYSRRALSSAAFGGSTCGPHQGVATLRHRRRSRLGARTARRGPDGADIGNGRSTRSATRVRRQAFRDGARR